MNSQDIEQLKKAISKKIQVTMSVRHGLGDIIPDTDFQPYIYGQDTYQYDFVWGFLPHSRLFYKFLIDNIEAVKLTDKSFDISKNACYQYSIEEDHYDELEGFDNIYLTEAKTAE